MNKLDEIEASINASKTYVNTNIVPTAVLIDYVTYGPLLIRAVRQLEVQLRHTEDCARIIANGDDVCDCYEGLIDPDVLELLERDSQ